MSAPDRNALRAASADASSISASGYVAFTNLLRDEPDRIGYPSEK